MFAPLRGRRVELCGASSFGARESAEGRDQGRLGRGPGAFRCGEGGLGRASPLWGGVGGWGCCCEGDGGLSGAFGNGEGGVMGDVAFRGRVGMG